MKMKKELYLSLLLFIFILLPSGSVYAQMPDLASFESLVEGANQDAFSESDIDNTNVQEDKSTKVKQESNFEDKNYGYTGGKSFNNPPREKYFDKPLSYFGYDFFIDAPTTFAPATNLPIPPDYILGPNDNITIILYGNKNAKYKLKVTREGEIFFPGIGPIGVAGLTFLDTKETIQKIVENQLIGTQVSITLGSLRSIDIFVLGDANQPGMFKVSSLTTLTNAIFKSGGINSTGSLRNIQLKRKGKVISIFDFYDLLLQGDTSNDAILMQGDVIFFPPIAKTVGIDGEVGRPGIYELKGNETLGDLIKFAGNLKPKADIFSVELKRVDPSENGFSLSQVELKDAVQDSFKLKNGDVFVIYPVINDLKKAVLVSGHARQPGFFPWKEGMRISDLFRTSADLLSMTDLNYVLVKREDKLTQKYQFLQTDLEEIFKNGSSNANIPLYEKDEIILLPSLLSTELITTKLIHEEYLFDKDKNQWVGEDEWTSITYLRKSLMEETGSAESINRPIGSQRSKLDLGTSDNTNIPEEKTQRYYEYSIYGYCSIPEEMVNQIVLSSGYTSLRAEKARELIPLEELERINTPEDVVALQIRIENQRIQERKIEKKDESELASMITQECRQQLLAKQLNIINKQIIPTQRKRTISVFGSVHFPGEYPLTKGMVLMEAIKAAGGLKDATFDSEIELSRSYDAGKKFAITNSSASISDVRAMGEALQEMDVINLKQISTIVKTVEITGEVYFTGVYPISENQTLSELIQRAGGVTDFGSTESAYFQREKLVEAEIERLESAKVELRRKIVMSSRLGGLGEATLDNIAISQLTQLITGDPSEVDLDKLGRLVINLEAILNGSVQDIILEDGDRLHIPKIQYNVSVIGEVFVPRTHSFIEDLTIDDYISLSGGVNLYGDEANIYLIRADGSMLSPTQITAGKFFKRNDAQGLQPGDSIVIPLQVQPFSAIKATNEITQIIYQMALAAAAVNSF